MKKPLIVLYIHKVPYPVASGGSQRILSMVRFLRMRYRVGLVVPLYKPEIEHIRNDFDEVWHGGKYEGVLGKIRFRWNKLIRGTYLWLTYRHAMIEDRRNALSNASVHAAWKLEQLCKQKQPALIIVYKVVNTIPITAIGQAYGIPVILDTIDLLFVGKKSSDVARMYNIPNGSDDIRKKQELELFSSYNTLLAIQHHEAKLLKEALPDKNILTVMHPITVKPFSKKEQKDSLSILFVGSSIPHNSDALQYFLDYQFPNVRAVFPTLTLRVCGAIAEARKENIPQVEWVGLVPDLAPYYAEATLVINPIRSGTGLKIKTVEALAYGKCLVTTPIGAEGIIGIEAICVCTSPEHIAQAIVELIKYPEQIRQYEAKALQYAKDHFTTEVCYQELADFLNQVIPVKK